MEERLNGCRCRKAIASEKANRPTVLPRIFFTLWRLHSCSLSFSQLATLLTSSKVSLQCYCYVRDLFNLTGGYNPQQRYNHSKNTVKGYWIDISLNWNSKMVLTFRVCAWPFSAHTWNGERPQQSVVFSWAPRHSRSWVMRCWLAATLSWSALWKTNLRLQTKRENRLEHPSTGYVSEHNINFPGLMWITQIDIFMYGKIKNDHE